MTDSQLADIRRNLYQSRRTTLQLIQDIDKQAAHYRIRADAWNIKDHVIHLVAVEESVIHFTHRILDEDCPISPLCYEKAFNQDQWNSRVLNERSGYSWSEAIDKLKTTRQELLALLETISPDLLARVGNHPVWGQPVTLASVLRVPYRHERAHRDEIAALSLLV